MNDRYDADHARPRSTPTESAAARTPHREATVRGVEATSGGLLRATLGSAVAASLILVLFWLPAEYGIDVTGLGRVMGLAEMGDIKQQLYAEAAAEDAAIAAQALQTRLAQTTADPQIVERLGAIEAQLAIIAAAVAGTASPSSTLTAPTDPTDPTDPTEATEATAATEPEWRDEVSYTLAPTQGIEVKLVMEKGAVAEFEWTANGAVLNHDTHGNGRNQRITYEQGRGVPGQTGELVAAFAGDHGWFWRNRTDAPVTFTLRTRGDYAEIKRP
jgi:hypothetical protein